MTEAIKAIKASVILIITKLSDKILGLISTLILARLLVPEDFGLVAIAHLIIGLTSTVTDSGGGAYLIQKEHVDDNDLNTAWTINLILKVIFYIALLGITPLAANYYNDDRLLLIIPILSSMVLIGALANPYIDILRKQQRYSIIFKIEIQRKILTVIIVVASAIHFQSYWALIIGHLVSNSIKATLSYLYLQYRPSLCISRWKEQIDFSKWMLAKGCFGYGRSQLDTFLVSSFYSPAQVGGYHLSKYISNMPASEGIAPALEPLLASFSKNKHNLHDFTHQIILTLLVVAITVIPLTSFIFFQSEAITHLLLGSQWLEYSNVFAVLSLLVIPVAIGKVAGQIATSQGHVKSLFYYDILSFFCTAIILLINKNEGLVEFATYKLGCDLFFTISLFLIVTKTLLAAKILNIILTFIIFILVAFTSGYLVQLNNLGNLPLVLSLLIKSSIFTLLWVGFCIIYFKVFLKNSEPAAHLKFILLNGFKKFRSMTNF